MKKFIDKIKVYLTTLWIAIISFLSKTFGQEFEDIGGWEHRYEPMYGVKKTFI